MMKNLKSYYHMSPNLHNAGEILKPSTRRIDYLGTKIGSILECNRPSRCISRLEAIYLNDSNDFTAHGILTEGYIYKVEAIGEIQTHYNHWLGILQRRYPVKGSQTSISGANYSILNDDDIAMNYWNGTKTDEGRQEFLVKSLKIVERLTEHRVPPSFNSPFNKALRKVREQF